MLPTKGLINNNDKTPYEIWFGTKPNINEVEMFGSVVFTENPKRKEDKGLKCIYPGNAQNQKGIKVHHLESSISFISRNFRFSKRKFDNITEECIKELDTDIEDEDDCILYDAPDAPQEFYDASESSSEGKEEVSEDEADEFREEDSII